MRRHSPPSSRPQPPLAPDGPRDAASPNKPMSSPDKAVRSFCLKAIAYLKVVLPDDDTSQPLKLPASQMPVLKALGGSLLVAYLVDEGDRFSYVQERHLVAAGLSIDELHTAAIDNLRAFAETNAEVRQHGAIYAVLAGGNFEASMLLVNDFWASWYKHLAPNGFAVAFPARDLLAFGDLGSQQAIADLHALCLRAITNQVDHPLTTNLYRSTDQGWRVLAS